MPLARVLLKEANEDEVEHLPLPAWIPLSHNRPSVVLTREVERRQSGRAKPSRESHDSCRQTVGLDKSAPLHH